MERDCLRDEINVTASFGEMLNESWVLQWALAKIGAVAEPPVNALIESKSGVGLESEFFGNVKRKRCLHWSPSRSRRPMTNRGREECCFLVKSREVLLALQSKLLRTLQEHECRVGGDDKTIRWMSESWPRPIETCRLKSRRDAFVKIYFVVRRCRVGGLERMKGGRN